MKTSIIIIGGGFGGLEAAFSLRELLGDRAEITLLDRNEFHSFIPSIHEISSGKVQARSIQIPLRTVLVPAGIRFVQDPAAAVTSANHQVVTSTTVLKYDYLVLATGAENHYYGIDGARDLSHRFRSVKDAECIYHDLVRLLSEQRRETHLVLAGGGTEGVEAAGEVVDLIESSGRRDDLAAGRITVTLIEGRQQVLPGFPQGAGEFAAAYLAGRGVTVLTDQRVAALRKGSLVLESGKELPQDMLLWSGGIKPSRFIEQLTLQKDAAGWLIVTDKLSTPDSDRIFAVGDAVSILSRNGPLLLPRLAYHAQDQAVVASLNIASHLQGRPQRSYEPRKKPQLISIGSNMGIFISGDRFRTGSWVVGLKKAVERKYLLAVLSRPALTAVLRKTPGLGLIKRMKLLLPF